MDIAAPGGKILSSVPLLTCEVDDKDSDGNDEWTPLGCGTDDPPTECTTTTNLRDYVEDTPQSCAHRIAHKSGTSMASPFVAGVVAHMLNRYPQATVGQVRQALGQSAMAAPSSEVLTRRGRINDPPEAPPSQKYGSGIVDPAKALTKLGEIR